jgi:coenzyme F420-dependent glucose-6-phosphate dehydrogenase
MNISKIEMDNTLPVGYFAAHEQYSPSTLLEHVKLAEQYGFDDVWSSDHFHPWAHTNANGGQAWAWIGAALASTKKIKIGTGVTPPGYRYHPGLIAQAWATFDEMFPGRTFLTLATGEAMNESPLGFPWPPIKVRQERLEEAVKIIKMLWEKDFVTYKGKYFSLSTANLYTKPKTKIKVYIAANGPKTAYLAGKYADGLLTLPAPFDYYKTKLFPSFEKGAKDAGKDPSTLEKIIEIIVSYDEDFDRAVEGARFWAGALVPFFFNYGVYDPRVIESVGRMIAKEYIAQAWMIVTNPEEAIKKTKEYLDAGFTHVQYLSSSPDEEKFIKVWGQKVIPALKELKG